MGKSTHISWTSSTFNFAYGCTKVSAGCDNCYMFRIFGNKRSRYDPAILTMRGEENAMKELKQCGQFVFVNSMSDTFHENMRFENIKFWMDIFKEQFPQKQFQVLTKRINKARQYAASFGLPDNVWLGTSVEDRWHTFRIKTLQRISQARIRFISFEPLLGPIGKVDLAGIHWAICGGESDYKKPRKMDPEWAEEIRIQCQEQDVAYWYKQSGGLGGDGAGGDTLNGRHYREYPKAFTSDNYQKPIYGF